MADLIRVSSTEFSKEVGRYQDLALARAVVVTRNGRDRTVMISSEEYARLVRGADREGRGAPSPRIAPAPRQLDPETRRAADAFLARIGPSHKPVAALLYGSRARGTHAPGSDADIAIILKGKARNRFSLLGPLADAAFDVLLETGVLVQPLPLFERELKRPELSANPALIETIKREGVPL